MRRLLRKPITWVALTIVVAGLAVGLALFEPWRAFTSSHVDEPIPVAADDLNGGQDDAGGSGNDGGSGDAGSAQPKELSTGEFVSLEHETSGTARVLELADGSRILRLEGFSTSDGPDVHVWLSDARSGGDGGSFDDGRYVGLGEMKATDGNQNYLIPDGAKLDGLRSVVIWCDRFDVAFGSAPLSV